ncbi:PEP-CTERM sorting domain-containing protein [Pontiellaceae bacterium B12227]|nr:PEP-CTERM sorting domain-containing protein [Pontiellaceae bacterium B12227]
MKKLLLVAASAIALGAQAGVITLGNTWQTGTANASSISLTGESATGFTAATSKGAWAYQLASSGDFTAEAFGIGDTVTMSFTTTMNADALSDPQDFRFAMWDESGQGGASVRMDWGPLTAANVAGIGVGDNMSPTAIGSYDQSVLSDALIPTSAFDTSGSVVDVSYSVTKTAANLFDVSLTWDDMTFGTTGLANATADGMDFISGIGIRINAVAGHDNNFTVSNMSVSVIPEPATLGLVAMVGVGMVAIRRTFTI